MSAKLLLAGPPLLFVLGVAVILAAEPVRALPRLDLAPSFEMTDPAAQPVAHVEFLGSVVLYSLVGAECDQACLATLDLVRALEPETERDWPAPFRLVTLVVEPVDRDRLRAIAGVTRSVSGRWQVLGGDAAAVRPIRQGFRVAPVTRHDGSVGFEPMLVLVDPAGFVRTEYRAPLPDRTALLADLGVLQEEIANARGPKRLVYEAVHFITCRVR
jgi:cytochrome oxidase Cu insertion factor (SCO1/SenC/PrrC family)